MTRPSSNPLPIPIKHVAAIVVLIVGLIWIWFSRVPELSTGSDFVAPQAGFISPEFSLEDLTGQPSNAETREGKPLVINFWASWCPPCRAEMPALEQAFQEYSDTDLTITAVNVTNQDRLSDVMAFTVDNQLTFPILLDQTGSTANDFQVRLLPTTFFVYRDGTISKVLIGGPIPLALMRVEIDRLLQE